METTNTYAARAGVCLAPAASIPSAAFLRPVGMASHRGTAGPVRTAIPTIPMSGTGVSAVSNQPMVPARNDGFGDVLGLPPWSPPVR